MPGIGIGLGLALAGSSYAEREPEPGGFQYDPEHFITQRGWADTLGHASGGEYSILKVTNLNASGSGSLRAALEASGARLIVFEVSGVIDLGGAKITVTNPYVTVAGQTAPSPGVAIIKGQIENATHDAIWSHLSFFAGTSASSGQDCFATTTGSYKVIIDHCAFFWGRDGNLDISGYGWNGPNVAAWRESTSHEVTVSACVIAENFGSGGMLISDNTTDILTTRNYFYACRGRNGHYKGGTYGVSANNLIYNPQDKFFDNTLNLAGQSGDSTETYESYIDLIGNVCQAGPDTTAVSLFRLVSNEDVNLYLSDNEAKTTGGTDYPDTSVSTTLGSPFGAINTVGSPSNTGHGATFMPKGEVVAWIKANVGPRPWDRGEHIQRVLAHYDAGTGAHISNQASVGGYPSLDENVRAFDPSKWAVDTPEVTPLDESVLVEVPSPAPVDPPVFTPEHDIAPFGTALIDETVPAGGGLSIDNTVLFLGKPSTKVNIPVNLGSPTFAVGTSAASFDLGDEAEQALARTKVFAVRTDGANTFTSAFLQVGNGGLTVGYQFTRRNFYTDTHDGWTIFVREPGADATAGTPDLTGNVRTRLTLTASANIVAGDIWIGFAGVLEAQPPTVVLTFDDGYAEWTWLASELASRGLPASFGISYGDIGKPGYLSSSEVQAIGGHVSGLFEITNHAEGNDSLGDLGLSGYIAEVEACRTYIEGLGLDPYAARLHAWVQGVLSTAAIDEMKDLGYHSARAVETPGMVANHVGIALDGAASNALYSIPATAYLNSSHTVADVQAQIEFAAPGGTVFVLGHEFKASAGPNGWINGYDEDHGILDLLDWLEDKRDNDGWQILRWSDWHRQITSEEPVTPEAKAVGRGTVYDTGTSITTSAGTTAEAGSSFLLLVSWEAGPAPTTVTDNKDNTYTLLGSVQSSTGAHNAAQYLCANGVGGAGHTATINFDGAGIYGVAHLIEIVGCTSNPLDKHVQGTDGSSPYTVASGTLSQADEVIVAFFAPQTANSNTIHESSNTTIISAETNGANFWASAVGTAVVSSTSSFSPSFTANGLSGTAYMSVMTFKVAP